ncbi:unnamed protein product, partial [marine sediment metagenome]
MKNPAEFAIERPRVVALATLLALLYGMLSYPDLPRQENPLLRERFAGIRAYLPGASPEQVELLVTKVIEEKVGEVDDIESMFSNTMHGMSFMQVEIKKGPNQERRLQEIREKVLEAQPLLPDGATEPEVDLRVLRTYTMILAMTGEGVGPLVLREHAKRLKRRFELMSDVGKISMLGEAVEEVEVAVDLHALSGRSLSLNGLVTTLAA